MFKTDPLSLKAQYDLLRSDPEAFVTLTSSTIEKDPLDSSNYFFRHQGWLRLNRSDLALADLDRSINLEPHYISYLSRGRIHAEGARHARALADFAFGESLDPARWRGAYGYLHQATSLAALGREREALAACARMPDDTWSPGLSGTPRGNKAEITAEIERRARAAPGRGR